MGVKKYFKEQIEVRKYFLEHDAVSDFYLCSFQRNRSATLLLILRTIIFVGCLSILVSSMVLTSQAIPFKYWPIYMTHWGLVVNTIAAGFALIVSFTAFTKGSMDASLGLPWLVKAYWATFNIATPIAFFITIFYWLLLTNLEQEFAINFTLDVFIHAVNSILMLVLLLSSRHPVNLSHFYFSIAFSFIYLIFTIIYYFAGGTDAFGDYTIYPMIDWSQPGETTGIMFLAAFGIVLLHVLTTAISEGRSALTKRFLKEDTMYNIDEAYY